MSGTGDQAAGRRRRWSTFAFAALMLALTGVFLVLGAWQWQRLGEKQALIATIESRMTRDPGALPAADTWGDLDSEFYDYRPLTVTGRFLPAETILVFTALGGARGAFAGPGYWVMTPLALDTGGTLFVNRGFVPQASGPAFGGGGTLPPGEVTLTGIARAPEQAGPFTPGTDTQRRIDWVRDPARLATLADPALAPVAPLYLDLPAGDPGALPQGGETVLEFPNNHLGYALTWFGFALLTPVLLAVWLLRRRGPPAP